MTTNSSTVKTWRERIGQPADFPLHAPTDVERAMEAEIAELRARVDQVAPALPNAQVTDLAARCGIKATDDLLMEFAALVREADPVATLVPVVEAMTDAAQAALEPNARVLAIPSAIMGIAPEKCRSDEYKLGHRDARHAAADLVLERADELVALAAAPSSASATSEMLDMLGRIDPFTVPEQKSQWFERLCRSRAVQQPLPVPEGAVVIWRCDLVRAVAELIQLRAFRDFVGKERARNAGGQQSDAARDVLAERRRQIEVKGWTLEHDDAYAPGVLSRAAACYALHADVVIGSWSVWPWPREWWKPSGDRRDLVKAAALLLAEIECLDRAPKQAILQQLADEAQGLGGHELAAGVTDGEGGHHD